jgi:hypothetical protein
VAAAAKWYEGAIAAYQPKGAASLAASYVNLANPGVNNAAPGVAPTWDAATGWIFNGSTQFLKTGIIGAESLTMIIRFLDASVSVNQELCGSTGAGVGSATRFRIVNNLNGQRAYYYGSAVTNRVTPSVTNGIMALAGNNGYFNGVPDGTPTGTWSGTGADNYIGASNFAGTTIGFSIVKVQAFGIWPSILTPAEVATVSAAMAAL